MKNLQITIFIFVTSWVTAQDGSDIIYFDAKKIDSSLIGKFIQIDFYNNSFGSNKFPEVIADTITLNFLKRQKFKEIRNDDCFNNWFSEQYLESTNSNKRLKL